MRVKLIQVTQNPIDVMWTAARTCYSEKSPVEMLDDWATLTKENYNELQEKHWNLVKKVLDSGHQSIAEHVYFTFAIEGISRACSHQLVRHRAGIVFSQQSQRYVEIKEDIGELVDLEQEAIKAVATDSWELYQPNPELLQLLEKYFTNVSKKTCGFYLKMLLNYLNRIANGMKPEDARQFLPNATKTNITMSVNFRELIHLCNLRLCTRAQLEIRNLFKEIVKCVKEVDERLASYLVPACEVHGVCQEKMCCGRKPKFEDVMNNYNAMRSLIKVKEADDALSTDDFELLKESMQNPHFNEKLSKLLKEPTIFDNYNEVCKELQELKENIMQKGWERDEND